jgi:alpha-galactosidase
MGGCNAGTAKVALDAANAFVKLGLKDVGYEYVNIDDCWSTKQRNSSGFLVADPQKWPNGVKAVADQIHGMGLKFGLYGSAGTKTCEGYPASRGYEDKDAQLLVSWGVDYWKYDNCYVSSTQSGANGSTRAYYPTMRDALQKTGKTLFFSLCQWGRDQVWTWGKDVGNSWRTNTDNWNDWASVVRIASHGATISSWGGPGGWNDLDMMVSELVAR